jgi:probable phosphoglycerate mutase
LCDCFVREFGAHADEVRGLFDELAARKSAQDFVGVDATLDARLEAFVESLERQFRREFEQAASRHVVFRHARTLWNAGAADQRRFQGRSDVPNEPIVAGDLDRLLAALQGHGPFEVGYSSPLVRCQASYSAAASQTTLPPACSDNRLIEIDYGACDGMTVGEARRFVPAMFAAWQRGEDPRFPGGESVADVRNRVLEFVAERFATSAGDSVCATHNGVLRVLVGQALGVPPSQQHRLRIGHLAPYAFIHSPRYGLFADFDETLQQETFADFIMNGTLAVPRGAATELRQCA